MSDVFEFTAVQPAPQVYIAPDVEHWEFSGLAEAAGDGDTHQVVAINLPEPMEESAIHDWNHSDWGEHGGYVLHI